MHGGKENRPRERGYRTSTSIARASTVDRAQRRAAGRVDEDIEPAQAAFSLAHQVDHVLGPRNIAMILTHLRPVDAIACSTSAADSSSCRPLIGHVATLPRQVDGNRRPDAFCAAGDQSAFVGEEHFNLFPNAECPKNSIEQVISVHRADHFSQLGQRNANSAATSSSPASSCAVSAAVWTLGRQGECFRGSGQPWPATT